VPISGEVGFIGAFTPVDSDGVQTDIASATGIDFHPDTGPNIIIANAEGDFIGADNVGTIMDFQFASFSSAIEDFWTVDVNGTTFAFDLTSVARVFTKDPALFLELEGTGVVSAAGFDDTVGTWSFSGNTTGTGATFSWSGGTATVPLPAPVWILAAGLGLIGFKQRLANHA
jgi:hypothetical protein